MSSPLSRITLGRLGAETVLASQPPGGFIVTKVQPEPIRVQVTSGGNASIQADEIVAVICK